MRLENIDYRQLTKEDHPYHRFHLNAVCALETVIVCSFLGTVPKSSLVDRLARRLRIQKHVKKGPRGGYFVIDRQTKRLKNVLRIEGVHDVKYTFGSKVLSTQYFTNSIVEYDFASNSASILPLRMNKEMHDRFLTRGIIVDGEHYLIGHTQRRGWNASEPQGLLRRYDHSGRWTGWEVAFPKVVGVYDFIKIN